MAVQCWNEQWLCFALGCWLYIPFIVGMCLPWCKEDKRSEKCYKIGWIFNILAFIISTIVASVELAFAVEVANSINDIDPTLAPISINGTNTTHFIL